MTGVFCTCAGLLLATTSIYHDGWIDFNKNGRKEMRVAVGDYQFTYVDDLLPDTFQAGIIACEGRNFFYDFKARRIK